MIASLIEFNIPGWAFFLSGALATLLAALAIWRVARGRVEMPAGMEPPATYTTREGQRSEPPRTLPEEVVQTNDLREELRDEIESRMDGMEHTPDMDELAAAAERARRAREESREE